MPSCIKSFVLPIAYCLTVISDQGALLAMLASLNQEKTKFAQFFAKWIEYSGKMQNGRVKDLCYMGQASLLKLTQADGELGALRVQQPRPSWMSADTPRKEMLL